MNKRSALLTASGLAASFVAGAAAFSVNWGLGSANDGTLAGGTANPNPTMRPIVKHRTIVVHRRAQTSPAGAPPQTLVLPAPSVPSRSAVVTTTGGSVAAGGEQEDSTGGGIDD